MTGTEKIIAHIESDAKAKADGILAEAEARCAEIRAGYEKQASDLYQEKIRAGVQACQDREDGALRISRMEARKAVLGVKQEMVSKSFDMALAEITSLPAADYVAFLTKLIRDAHPTGTEEIVLNPKDRAAVGEKLLQAVNALPGMAMKLSDDTRDIAGGLLLRRGNVETNCSAELLIDLTRSALSSRLAEVLFG
ncbi:MAG: hypothetical protein K6C12_02670 [Oscillospiraceae bacterium]|nr:hypothetical protein [Oscillospiraceae bacterium]